MTQKERERLKYLRIYEEQHPPPKKPAHLKQIQSQPVYYRPGKKTARGLIPLKPVQVIEKSYKDAIRSELTRAQRLSLTLNAFPLSAWHEILERYQHSCAYCGKTGRMTMDHIMPVSKGGFHHRSNIIPACQRCNSRKGNRPAHLYKPKILPW